MQKVTQLALDELFEAEQEWQEFIELDNFDSLVEFNTSNPFMQDDIKDFVTMLHSKEVYGKYKGSVVIGRKFYVDEEVTDKNGVTEIKRVKKLKHLKWVNLGKDSNGVNKLTEALRKFQNQNDIYININPSKNFKSRGSDNVHQLKFLYQDLDIVKYIENNNLNTTLDIMCEKVYSLFDNGILPRPTMIINSGRGLHLYWNIGDYTPTPTIINYWRDLQEQLYNALKEFGSDRAVSNDYSRVLRVPMTINSRNNKTCRIVEYNQNAVYTLDEIRTYFENELNKRLDLKKKLIEKRRARRQSIKQKENNVININPFLTVNRNRYDDLIKLINLRDGAVGNCRSRLILLTTYYYRVNNPSLTDEEVLENAITINELFTDRLPFGELRGYVKGALKYNDKRLMLNEEDKKGIQVDPSKTRGFNPRNKLIIEWLGITTEEERQLKTIHSEEISKELKNIKRKQARRGEDGLTPKQREQMEKRKKAIELQTQGLSLAKISKELTELFGKSISIGSVRNLLK